MDFGLVGKVALVTGTASQVGMGKAICSHSGERGLRHNFGRYRPGRREKDRCSSKSTGRKAIARK